MTLTIRDADPGDETVFRALWDNYLGFYKTELKPGVTEATWKRILAPTSGLFARLAEHDGRVVGFAVCVMHEGSWVNQPICYLEDLFVTETLRGQGIGRRLIEDLVALAKAHRWARVYWHTEADNTAARALYDKFSKADGVRYRIAL